MAYDYSKLKGRIREVFGTQDEFAKAIELSNTSVSLRLNNQREWTQQDISKSAEALNIPENEIYPYFFTEKV